MSQRDAEDVVHNGFCSCWNGDLVPIFVNGFVHKLIYDTLWDCLWFTHHFLLQKYLLPIKFLLIIKLSTLTKWLLIFEDFGNIFLNFCLLSNICWWMNCLIKRSGRILDAITHKSHWLIFLHISSWILNIKHLFFFKYTHIERFICWSISIWAWICQFTFTLLVRFTSCVMLLSLVNLTSVEVIFLIILV